MVKKILLQFIPLIFGLSTVGHAQHTFFAVASGPWSSALTWANAPGGTPGTGGVGGEVPGTGDNVLTQGFNISIGGFFVSEVVTCNNIAIANNVANGIMYGGLFSTGELIVEGGMAAYTPGVTPVPAAPTVAVIENTPFLTITFTGSGASPLLSFWNTNAPFYNLNINPGTGNTASFFSPIAIGGGTFNIMSGTFNSNFAIQDASMPATSILDVNTGAVMNINNPITMDGTATSKFNQANINGTANILGMNYLNADIFNLNAGATLNVQFNGANQTEGWWHTTAAPTSPTLNATSTVNFSANADQALPAFTYGNLTLSATTGSHNKTVDGTGNFIVNGTFTVSSSSVVFNSNAASSSNLDLRGDIVNFGTWGTFVNTNLRLNGTSTQNVSGGDPINIQDLNVIVNNPAGVMVTNNLDIDENLTITNGTLSIDGADFTIGGNFTNNGGFSQTGGGTTFDGSNPQEVSGSATTNFLDVTALNGDLEFESDVTIAGILTLGDGVSLEADGSDDEGSLTLLSIAGNTARVAPLPASAFIGGNVSVQRFMAAAPAGSSIFRYISSPISNGTASGWTSTPGVNGNPWQYNEVTAGASHLGWAQTSGALTVARGYALQANSASAITLELTGLLNQGPQTRALTYTNGVGDADVGWNLVGNPYASSIDLDNISLGAADPNVVLSDNTATGSVQYHYYNTSTGMGTGPISSGLIASGQSFWVLATGAGQSVGFNENSKTTNNGAFRRDSDVLQGVLTINLNQDGISDVALIGVRDGATPGYDEVFDAYKRTNGIFNIASYTEDHQRTAINVFDQLENGRVIKLDLYNIDPGSYSFSIEETLDESLSFVLIDNFLNEETPIVPDQDGKFIYNFEVTTDELTYGAARFSIQVGESVITGIEEDLDNVVLYPNPLSAGEVLNLNVSSLFDNVTSVDIGIIDQKGALLSEQTVSPGINGSVEIDMDAYRSGVYILRVIGNNATHHYKVIKN